MPDCEKKTKTKNWSIIWLHSRIWARVHASHFSDYTINSSHKHVDVLFVIYGLVLDRNRRCRNKYLTAEQLDGDRHKTLEYHRISSIQYFSIFFCFCWAAYQIRCTLIAVYRHQRRCFIFSHFLRWPLTQPIWLKHSIHTQSKKK